MANILYGVAGQGFGHSSRSELFGRMLLEAGHNVMFAASRKSYSYLKPHFADRVQEVYGLGFCYQNGCVRPVHTLIDNLVGYRSGLSVNHRLFSRHVKKLAPDLVISDFEPFTAWWAWRNNVPCLSVDHEHLLTLGVLESMPGHLMERLMAKIVVRGYHTFANSYIVLNFFDVPLRGRSSVLAPPVLRRQVLQQEIGRADHVVAYCTDSGSAMRESLLKSLSQFPRQQFLIYGFDEECQNGNCTMKLTDTAGFLRDLASCRGVIASAGFTLVSECLHFGKRMLLVPASNQFEQIVNAWYVESLGLGIRSDVLNSQCIEAFLESLDTPIPAGGRIVKPDNEKAAAILNECAEAANVPLNLIRQSSCTQGRVIDAECGSVQAVQAEPRKTVQLAG